MSAFDDVANYKLKWNVPKDVYKTSKEFNAGSIEHR